MKLLKTVSHARHFGYRYFEKEKKSTLDKRLFYDKSFGLWYWTILW